MATLRPKVENGSVTVDYIMRNPTFLAGAVDKLIDNLEVMSTFFTISGTPVVGGGIVYSVVSPSMRYTADDVVERGPGDEYAVVRGVDPEARLAAVRDWGGKFDLLDEHVTRNNQAYLKLQLAQLANTLARKLNLATVAAVNDSLSETPGEGAIVGSSDWSNFLIVGPADQITPNQARPAADWVNAQLDADEDRLGVRFDTLVVSPTQAANLRVGYGDTLATVLASVGLTMVVLDTLPAGTAYLVEKGRVGTVGFEFPLTVEPIDKRENRKKIIQGFVVPGFAVERPYAVRKITALASA